MTLDVDMMRAAQRYEVPVLDQMFVIPICSGKEVKMRSSWIAARRAPYRSWGSWSCKARKESIIAGSDN